MRFLIVLSPIFLLFNLFSCAEKKQVNYVKSDLEDFGLTGNVEILKQDEYYSLDGGIIGERTNNSNSYTYKFNKSGDKIAEQQLDSLGEISTRTEYFFSENGQKLRKTITNFENKVLHSYTYNYDKQGQLVKINVKEIIDGQTIYYCQKFNYDRFGNEISTSTESNNGLKIKSSKSIYNRKNEKIKLTLLDNMDSPVAIAKYEYNSNGDIKRELIYTGNNLLFEEYNSDYLYDSHKNWIKKIYTLHKKHMVTSGNAAKKEGVKTITFRTITYY
jgi:hypothetical protein